MSLPYRAVPSVFPLPIRSRRRQSLKCVRNLLLPGQSRLAVNLGSRLEILPLLEQDCADYDFVAHDGLMVVNVGRTVWAIVAVYCFSCRKSVSVFIEGM